MVGAGGDFAGPDLWPGEMLSEAAGRMNAFTCHDLELDACCGSCPAGTSCWPAAATSTCGAWRSAPDAWSSALPATAPAMTTGSSSSTFTWSGSLVAAGSPVALRVN
jgi:hypothetical protein